MPPISTDAFVWGVIGLFLIGTLAEAYTPWNTASRTLTALAWVLFGIFWGSMAPYFLFEHRSFIEGGLAVLALPAFAYTGYLLYNGRSSLFMLSRAVAIMGLIYLPVGTLPGVHQWLIEATTVHTELAMSALGYTPMVETGGGGLEGYRNAFVFPGNDPRLIFSIVLACTGFGSIAIFAGLIGAAREPLSTKLRALGLVVPIIYALNIARTTFIAITYGHQKLHIAPDLIMGLFGVTSPSSVSFIIADRILAQSFALITLIVLGFVTIRLVPSLVLVAEDLLYILTRNEYDLAGEFGYEPNDKTDDTL